MRNTILALLSVAALTSAGCSRERPGPPEGMARGSAPPQVPSRPLETESVAAQLDPGSMSEPASLTINADRSGAVFIDGEPIATETPVSNSVLPAGRHSVQILSDDSQYLSEPRYVVLRNGSTVSVFIRNGEVGGSVNVVDQRTAPTDGSGALMPDAASAEGSAPAVEAPTTAFEDGSGTAEPGTTEPATAEAGAPGPVVQLLLVDRDAPAPEQTFRLHVVSEPDGVIFLDGVNTGVRTPTVLEIDARPATIQVLQDGGNLSRHFPVTAAAGQGREVFFTGIESFLYR